MLLCAAALLLKLVMPTGYMIGNDHGRIEITICTGMVPATMAMDMPGVRGDMSGHGKSKEHGKAEQPCAFAGLSAAMTGPVDPIRLAELIAFIMTIGIAGVLLPTPAAPARLRPPLRGPPATI